MVREIKQKNIFKLLKQTASEISHNTFGAYAFMLVLFVVIAITFILARTQQDIRQRADGKTADLILTFNTESTSAGKIMLVDVSVNSHNTPIDEVQFNFSYPDRKAVPKITYDNSIFSIQNEELTRSGVIRIGRNTDKIVTGKTHIGTIQFSALEAINASEINQLPDSKVIAHDKKNIPLYIKKEFDRQEKTQEPNNTNFIEKIITYLRGLVNFSD